jgi:G3E family GTPase
VSRAYLVTGFLGAGKTTFIKNFVRLFPPRGLALIINEFGRENVDIQLLKDMRAALYGIDGGSIFCSCRAAEFEKALADASLTAETVVVETTGLADPGAARAMIGADALQNVICVADAQRLPKVYETAKIVKKQLACASSVILNKLDRATPDETAAARAILRSQCPDVPVYDAVRGAFPGMERLLEPVTVPRRDDILSADLSLRKLMLTVRPAVPRAKLEAFLRAFVEDTYRVKGFVQTAEGPAFVDCVGGFADITPAPEGANVNNHLVVLYGYGLRARSAVEEAGRLVPGVAEEAE